MAGETGSPTRLNLTSTEKPYELPHDLTVVSADPSGR